MNDDPIKIRREITNLKSEIAFTERKHQGTAQAIAARKKQLSRLEAQLAMCGAGPVLAPTGCRL